MSAKILLIDDDEDYLNIYSELFSLAACEVHKASNLVEAMSLVIRNPDFDVALVDWRLGESNAEEFIHWLRQNFKGQLILLVTGDLDVSAKSLPTDEVVMKPFDLNRVLGLIENHRRRKALAP